MTEHRTSVILQTAFWEWRAECSCGWIGSYFRLKQSGDTEAARHVAAHRARR